MTAYILLNWSVLQVGKQPHEYPVALVLFLLSSPRLSTTLLSKPRCPHRSPRTAAGSRSLVSRWASPTGHRSLAHPSGGCHSLRERVENRSLSSRASRSDANCFGSILVGEHPMVRSKGSRLVRTFLCFWCFFVPRCVRGFAGDPPLFPTLGKSTNGLSRWRSSEKLATNELGAIWSPSTHGTIHLGRHAVLRITAPNRGRQPPEVFLLRAE